MSEKIDPAEHRDLGGLDFLKETESLPRGRYNKKIKIIEGRDFIYAILYIAFLSR